MSPKKLTEDDKTEILKLYRETSATTSTLSEQYGVSSSTISRYLKNSLSDGEYEDLIQKKRLARTTKPRKNGKESDLNEKQTSLELYLTAQEAESPAEPQIIPILIKKEKIKEESEIVAKSPSEMEETLEITPEEEPKEKEKPILRKKAELVEAVSMLDSLPLEEDEEGEDSENLDVVSVGEMFGEDIADDEEEEDDDEDDWDDEDDEDEEDYSPSFTPKDQKIQILPFSDASFPSTCYLVVDRTAELITCPLREFTHLGMIPETEVSQKTLPIFDNHRVARRFSKRSQRVIKVPDGKLFQKTYSHLADKGITRLLLDGQIYALV